jgi:hypothetical protein
MSMASKGQISANRRNSQNSTGPRTREGKQRSSRNSRRHGLAARKFLDQEAVEAAEKLALEIVNDSRGAIPLDVAWSFATANIELAWIRRIKGAVLDLGLAASNDDLTGQGERNNVASEMTSAVADVLPELIKIDRYELRSRSTRDRALRQCLADDERSRN